jgi:hypothetical protein
VGVEVRVIAVAAGPMQVEPLHPVRTPDTERQERDAHAGFGARGKRGRQASATPREQRPCGHDHRGVADAPPQPQSGRSDDPGPATYEGRDRHHMIHFEGVGGPQDERRRVGGPGSIHVASVQERVMTDTPRDQKPRIRLTTLSHGAG